MVPFEENSPPRVAFINRLRNSSMNISIMSIDEESLKQFLDYKKSKIDSIKNIEWKTSRSKGWTKYSL